jgi:hypothetical protein
MRETSTDDDTWAARWTHEYLNRLQTAGNGPLHTGQWTLAWGMPSWSVTGHWQRLHTVDPDEGHITWFGYGDPEEDQRDILPLRRLSPLDAARVRSYRRQVNEGIMPPVLLWWVSGLDTLLVLDGHDRIAAAVAERTVPAVVVLAPASDPLMASSAHKRLVREYEGRQRHMQLATDAGDELAKTQSANITRRFAGQLNDVTRSEGRTRAWPLPGGTVVWRQLRAQLAPDWTIGPA